ncbi:unnamed protein product [Mytilus coruscus]|uniref:THAP-type domain-containing protein n=1 Tax=Mytilus coruscus TaxID=42192 RepID=A0A6J8B7J8_MYTCO|nr:unnamed protein product [Mytilus coruscus]
MPSVSPSGWTLKKPLLQQLPFKLPPVQTQTTSVRRKPGTQLLVHHSLQQSILVKIKLLTLLHQNNNPTKLPQNNDTATLPQKSDSTKISSTSNPQKKRKKAEVSDSSASQSALSLDNSNEANIDKEESISNTMSYALCMNSLNEHTYATPNKTTAYTPQLATSTPIYPAQYLQYPPPQPQNMPNHVPMIFQCPFQTQQSPPLFPHQQPNDVSRLLTEVLSRLKSLDQKLGRLDEIDKKLLKLDTVSTNLGKLNSQVQNLEGNLVAVIKWLGDVEKKSVFVSGKLEDITKENKNIMAVSKNQNKILHERIASVEKQNTVFKAEISKIANEKKNLNLTIIGKHCDGKIRPILVKFENRNDRQDIRFAAPKHLVGKPFGVHEHFPHEVVKIRKDLLPIHKEERKQKLKVVLKRDKLCIDGELFDKTKHSHLIRQPEAMDEGSAQGDSNIKFLAWNVIGGLQNKLDDEAFVRLLKTYDIVILSECWISNDFTFDIEGIMCKAIPRNKSKCTQGGGLCVMINNIYSPYISFIESIADTFMWLKFDKLLFDFDQDLYVCGAYIPPINTKYHSLYECDIFRLMEDNIISYSSKGKICLVGDLNCRTSNVSDFIEDDTVYITLQNQLPNLFNYSNDSLLSTRINPDTIYNDNGSKLIKKICKSTGLRIVNGRHKDGLSNDYTYCGPKSFSVIDYFLTTVDLFRIIDKFIVSSFTQFSDHANLHLEIKIRNVNFTDKLITDCELDNGVERKTFKEALSNNTDNLNSLCENLNFESQNGIDKNVSDFSEFLNGIMSPYFKVKPKVSTSRKKQVRIIPTIEDKPWFNDESSEINSEENSRNGNSNNDKIPVYEELHCVINNKEILCAISSLKRSKSHGIDGLLNEYFIEFQDMLMPAVGRLGGKNMLDECKELRTKILEQSTVPWNIRVQISKILETWKMNNSTFVETRATKHVLECVQENSCVTITASPGVGKTATLRHVALKMADEGYNVLIVLNTQDIVHFYNPNQKTLFIMDDFCGTYSIDQSELNSRVSVMERIKELIKNKLTKIIVACRLQVYQDKKFESLPIFRTCVCNLLSEDLCLLPTEKLSIANLYLETKATEIMQYCDLYDCFPLICKLYNDNPELNIIDFFKNPFSIYESEIDKLHEKGNHEKYCALALCVMFNNRLKEEWLTDDINKIIRTMIENTCEACRLDRGTSRLVILDELETLEYSFIKKEQGVFKTIHDKIFDFLSFYFGKKMIQCLIKNADFLVIMQRFLLKETNDMDQFITVVPPKYHEMYIQRIIDDWSSGRVQIVFSNINMKIQEFRQRFLYCLNKLTISFQRKLALTCDVNNKDTVLLLCCYLGDIPFIHWCIFHGVDVNQCSRTDQLVPLHISAQEGRTEVIKVLLKNKADINKCMDDGGSPLFIACHNNRIETVKVLLDNKADINKCIENGASPVYIACHNNHIELVKVLLDYKADINKCTDNGISPLYIACHNNHIETVKVLLDNKADINKGTDNGASPLYIACHNNHIEIVKVLLDYKADIDKCTENGASPLYMACYNNHIKTVKILLDNKADINKCTDDGVSPLYVACHNNCIEIVKVLLDNKADINKCADDGVSPLYIACHNDYKETVKLLLDNRADINKCRDTGVSPLYIACENNHIETVKVLLHNKADINKCRDTGASPLFVACQYNCIDTVKVLLDNKADINKCRDTGVSPLYIACENNHIEIVKVLLDNKADINKCRDTGASPLFVACYNNHKEIVRILLEKGSNYTACTIDGWSPIGIAIKMGHRYVIDMINEHSQKMEPASNKIKSDSTPQRRSTRKTLNKNQYVNQISQSSYSSTTLQIISQRKTPKINQKWIKAIRRNSDKNKYWKPSKVSVVCRSHFKPTDFIMETSRGTATLVKRLKKEAVPNVFPWTNTFASPSSLQKATCKTRREENKSGFDTDSDTSSEENNSAEWNEELDSLDVGSEIYYTAEKFEDSELNLHNNQTETFQNPVTDSDSQTQTWPALCVEKFEDDPAGIKFYTGLQSHYDFTFVLTSLGEAAYNLNYLHFRSEQLSVANHISFPSLYKRNGIVLGDIILSFATNGHLTSTIVSLVIASGDAAMNGCDLLTYIPQFTGERPKSCSYFYKADFSYFYPCNMGASDYSSTTPQRRSPKQMPRNQSCYSSTTPQRRSPRKNLKNDQSGISSTTPQRRSPRKKLKNDQLGYSSTTPKRRSPRKTPNNCQVVKLVENASFTVNSTELRKIVLKAKGEKNTGSYLVLKLMDLVFSMEEMGHSKCQGLRSAKSGDTRLPLDAEKIKTVKAYSEGFCRKNGRKQATAAEMNRAISQAVAYSRKKLKKQLTIPK